MGKFTSELELTLSGSIRNAFITAKLLDPQNVRESIKDITIKYLNEQIPAHSSSIRAADETLVSAYNVLNEALDPDFDSPVSVESYPTVLYTQLVENCDKDLTDFVNEKRNDLAMFLLREMVRIGVQDLPSVNDLMQCTLTQNFDQPLWDMAALERSASQSEESFLEQSRVLKLCKKQIRQLYVNCHNKRHPKCICTVGGPGCGKTAVNLIALFQALSMGFICATTVLLSDRANELTGMHLHRIYCLHQNPSKKMTFLYFAAGRMARYVNELGHDGSELHFAITNYLIDLTRHRDVVVAVTSTYALADHGAKPLAVIDRLVEMVTSERRQDDHPIVSCRGLALRMLKRLDVNLAVEYVGTPAFEDYHRSVKHWIESGSSKNPETNRELRAELAWLNSQEGRRTMR